MDEIQELYFEWMYQIVCGSRQFSARRPYYKLMRHLYEVPFTYFYGNDGDRAADGVHLRYRFGDENRYKDYEIANELDQKPCSVLEMMVALALRCEESIMTDPDIGNRTPQWFWEMISSLQLDSMTDYVYDENLVDSKLTKFMSREYDKDGAGSLFYVKDSPVDMRTTEIWYQMCRYLSTI